jgi:hypothetical protein
MNGEIITKREEKDKCINKCISMEGVRIYIFLAGF